MFGHEAATATFRSPLVVAERRSTDAGIGRGVCNPGYYYPGMEYPHKNPKRKRGFPRLRFRLLLIGPGPASPRRLLEYRGPNCFSRPGGNGLLSRGNIRDISVIRGSIPSNGPTSHSIPKRFSRDSRAREWKARRGLASHCPRLVQYRMFTQNNDRLWYFSAN